MAFSFGAPAASPAPAAGGFSFGGTPAAPTPAPAAGGFSFGGTPAATPAPAAGGFSFGGTPAAATPAPSAFSFAGTTAPTAATSPGTSLFSSTPATTGFQQQHQPLQQQPQHAMTANTPYKSLPPNAQKLIDDIYKLVHQHEQTMSSVSTMQPILLNQQAKIRTDSADIAAGSSTALHQSEENFAAALANKISSLQHGIKQIKQDLEYYKNQTNDVFNKSSQTLNLTLTCGVYPLQETAARRGITQEQLPELYQLVNSASQIAQKLNEALLNNTTHVDYMVGMPSTYLWSTMDDLVERMNDLGGRLQRLNKGIESKKAFLMQSTQHSGGVGINGRNNLVEDMSQALVNQVEGVQRIAAAVGIIEEHMKSLRTALKDRLVRDGFQNRNGSGIGVAGVGTGSSSGISNLDPFAEADERERDYERRLEAEFHKRSIDAAPPAPPAPTPAPAPTGLFGSTTPAPATGGGLFGSTPAPAPGGLFGSTPASSPGGGLFGSTPAPAPGGLFGSTAPAPAPGGLFGSTAPALGAFGATTPAPAATSAFGAPAPAPGGLFGSTTPAPAASSAFSFGNTAPAAGGLFGAATPAPAPTGGFGFGATPAPASTTSRSRRKPGRRR